MFGQQGKLSGGYKTYSARSEQLMLGQLSCQKVAHRKRSAMSSAVQTSSALQMYMTPLAFVSALDMLDASHIPSVSHWLGWWSQLLL